LVFLLSEARLLRLFFVVRGFVSVCIMVQKMNMKNIPSILFLILTRLHRKHTLEKVFEARTAAL
jgi:hypothetical protein